MAGCHLHLAPVVLVTLQNSTPTLGGRTAAFLAEDCGQFPREQGHKKGQERQVAAQGRRPQLLANGPGTNWAEAGREGTISDQGPGLSRQLQGQATAHRGEAAPVCASFPCIFNTPRPVSHGCLPPLFTSINSEDNTVTAQVQSPPGHKLGDSASPGGAGAWTRDEHP